MNTNLDLSAVRRIQALLALAADGGATEAEALNAAEKAQFLMAKHNLHIAQVEAAGSKATDSARIKSGMTDRTVYKWRRSLMEAVAKLNFCYCELKFKYREYNKASVFSGFELIGRESNVASSRVMYDYLIQSIERLAREHAADVQINMFAASAVLFREGCSVRLQERLQQRHRDILDQQEKEARAAREANAQYAGSTLPSVVLRDYVREETELNDDLRCGREPGTATHERKEREARAAAMDAYMREHGCHWNVAYDVITHGKTHAQAQADLDAINARHATAVTKPETEAQRRRREDKEARADRRWREQSNRRYDREARRTDDPGYRAGHAAGSAIGLDAQVDNQENRRIGK